MSPPLALLAGHGPREPGRYDPGARAPACAAHPNGWTEADLVRAIGLAAVSVAPGSVLASEGTYTERGRLLGRLVPGAPVLQLHADAVPAEVGPDRATLWSYPHNAAAALHAERLRTALAQVLPWPVTVRVADPGEAWQAGVLNCLEAVAQDSVLLEVGYSDGALGRELLPRLAPVIGYALAVALAGASPALLPRRTVSRFGGSR